MTDKNIYIKAHYCIICKKSELCIEEDCDYREILFAHGNCYAELSPVKRGEHDRIVEGELPSDIKEAYDKARRKIYMREYNRQWNLNHPKYHNKYHHDNPNVVKPASYRYSKSDKGKIARKRYEEKSKQKKAKYMKNYMKEYREKQKNILDPNNYSAQRAMNMRMRARKKAKISFFPNKKLVNPMKQPNTVNPNKGIFQQGSSSAFSKGLGMGLGANLGNLGKLPPTLKAQRSPRDKRATQVLQNAIAQQRHTGFNKMSQAEKKAYLHNQMMRSFGSDPKDLKTNPKTDDKIMALTSKINSLTIELMTLTLSPNEKTIKKAQLDNLKLERKKLRALK